MALTPAAYPPYDTIRGVHFCMLSGALPISIMVLHEALQGIDGTSSTDYLALFLKHKSQLEQIASDKHERGQIEETGSIVIWQGDR